MTANFSKASFRMYPTAQAASQPVEIEPTYFVEYRNLDIYLNDEPLAYPTTAALAIHLVLKRDYSTSETLPQSGVYRLTVAELKEVRNRAQAVLQDHQEAQGAAPAPSPVVFDTGDDCLTCERAEECEARSLLECPFSDLYTPELTARNLEASGAFDPRCDF